MSSPSKTGAESTDKGTESKCTYFGVTFRSRHRGKFQSRIYKHNKEYNLGLYDLACDAALAYDSACRLFNRPSEAAPQRKGEEAPAEGSLVLAELDEAKRVFDWLDLPDSEASGSDALERLNFLTPSLFREARAKEIPSRFHSEGQNLGLPPTEASLRLKIRKEVLQMAKVAAIGTPSALILGKRASEFDFGPMEPQPEVKKRKKAKKGQKVKSRRVEEVPSDTHDDVAPVVQNPVNNLVLPALSQTNTAQFTIGPPVANSTLERQQDLRDRIASASEQLRKAEVMTSLCRHQLDGLVQEYLNKYGCGTTTNVAPAAANPSMLLPPFYLQRIAQLAAATSAASAPSTNLSNQLSNLIGTCSLPLAPTQSASALLGYRLPDQQSNVFSFHRNA
jgi:hypothetical protein